MLVQGSRAALVAADPGGPAAHGRLTPQRAVTEAAEIDGVHDLVIVLDAGMALRHSCFHCPFLSLALPLPVVAILIACSRTAWFFALPRYLAATLTTRSVPSLM